MNDLTRHSPKTAAPAGSRMRRWAAAAGLAMAAALGLAGQAQARDVYWNVGVGAPGVSVGVGNAPVYVAPAPVYVAPPVYHAPRPVYYAPPRPVYYAPPPPPRYYGHGYRHHKPQRHWREDGRRHHHRYHR